MWSFLIPLLFLSPLVLPLFLVRDTHLLQFVAKEHVLEAALVIDAFPVFAAHSKPLLHVVIALAECERCGDA
jgi:hypothetical protein